MMRGSRLLSIVVLAACTVLATSACSAGDDDGRPAGARADTTSTVVDDDIARRRNGIEEHARAGAPYLREYLDSITAVDAATTARSQRRITRAAHVRRLRAWYRRLDRAGRRARSLSTPTPQVASARHRLVVALTAQANGVRLLAIAVDRGDRNTARRAGASMLAGARAFRAWSGLLLGEARRTDADVAPFNDVVSTWSAESGGAVSSRG